MEDLIKVVYGLGTIVREEDVLTQYSHNESSCEKDDWSWGFNVCQYSVNLDGITWDSIKVKAGFDDSKDNNNVNYLDYMVSRSTCLH